MILRRAGLLAGLGPRLLVTRRALEPMRRVVLGGMLLLLQAEEVPERRRGVGHRRVAQSLAGTRRAGASALVEALVAPARAAAGVVGGRGDGAGAAGCGGCWVVADVFAVCWGGGV